MSALDCQDALRNLARLSLLTIDSDPQASGGTRRVLVHALVQRATTEHLTAQRVETLVRAGADALIQVWPDIERDLPLSQLLRVNATTLAERPGRGSGSPATTACWGASGRVSVRVAWSARRWSTGHS